MTRLCVRLLKLWAPEAEGRRRGAFLIMSGFDSWSERDIFLAKRSAEMETASVAHTNFTTSTRRSVPMHRDSSQISDLLNPVRGIRDAQLRYGARVLRLQEILLPRTHCASSASAQSAC